MTLRPTLLSLLMASLTIACTGPSAAGRKHGAPSLTFAEALERNTRVLRRDLQSLEGLLSDLGARAGRQWGQHEARVADRTVYVKYTESYHTRAITDFDRGTVTVETVDGVDPEGSLRKAIVTTLLTTSDPRSVDLFSDAAVATGRGDPFLLGLVLDQDGAPIRTAAQAERFAAHLLATRCRSHSIETAGGPRPARFVKIGMVANYAHRNVEKYRAVVARFARQFGVSPSLVFAIIRMESNFNPFAVSRVPAFGLMQLVPRSGGRDAYRRARGVDADPTPELLFDPETNIELGTAYLSVLAAGQLAQITDPVAREYCVIAAYNTGTGNVLRAFGDRKAALAAINALPPRAVYDRLRASLPYQETSVYLAKVVAYRRQFLGVTGEPDAAPDLALR